MSKPILRAGAADVVRCFDAAVHNAVDINTVPCDYATYNSTGLLKYPYMVRAGGNYETPWTRDAAINTWNAMRYLDPEAARTTLFAVCTADEKGDPVIQPDVQTWDQIVWTVGAWSYYLATGDEEFLAIARGVVGRALKSHRVNRFNEKYQLFRGGSFFNDGIAGYPLECHVPDLYDSFGPAHPVVETIMCFSTNCLFCEAYRIYGEMAAHFGDEEEAKQAMRYHDELKDTVNRVFWDEELGRYRYILYPDGHMDCSQEASGHAFAVLFDICPQEKQAALLEGLVYSERGMVSVWPPFEGLYSDDKPGRHNNVVWPFLNGMLLQAAAKCGLHGLIGQELERITALYKGSDFELFEIYSPYTGEVYGGWQLDHVWESCHDQTWSATCYIGAFLQGIFGMNLEKKGIRFAPSVPESLKDASLADVDVHGMKLTVEISGFGSKIDAFTADGVPSAPFLPWDGKAHNVKISLC